MNKITKKDFRGRKAISVLKSIENTHPDYCFVTESGEKGIVIMQSYDGEWGYSYEKVTYLLKKRGNLIVTKEEFQSTFSPYDTIRDMRGCEHWERYTVAEALRALDYIG